MLKKTTLYSALVFAFIAPLSAIADIQSDKEMTAKIEALYATSPLLKSSKIEVQSNDNNISLKGALTTDMQYEKAVSLAQSVPDVIDVKVDELKVKESKAPIADTYITAKVKGMLMKEKLFGSKAVEYWPVSIETKNGVVYLVGKVDTEEQGKNIANIAKSINGVKSVNNIITVK